MRRLRASLDRRHRVARRDPAHFNVAPEPRDVDRPEKWASTVLFHPEVREALGHIVDFGLADTLRLHTQADGLYSWWDYRQLSFPKNDGLRLDLILATPSVGRACTAASIDISWTRTLALHVAAQASGRSPTTGMLMQLRST